MVPPTRKVVAMPIWLKLRAMAVAVERSVEPNQVAERRGDALEEGLRGAD